MNYYSGLKHTKMSEEEQMNELYLSDSDIEEALVSVGSYYVREKIRKNYRYYGKLPSEIQELTERIRARGKLETQIEEDMYCEADMLPHKLQSLIEQCETLLSLIPPHRRDDSIDRLQNQLSTITEIIYNEMTDDNLDVASSYSMLLECKDNLISHVPELREVDEHLTEQSNDKLDEIAQSVTDLGLDGIHDLIHKMNL